MKIRTDFVANSSSSSFILARKGALTEQQKAAIIAYVEENLLGQRVETLEQLREFADKNGFSEDGELFREAMGITVSVENRMISVEEQVLFLLLYAIMAIGAASALSRRKKS